MLIGKFEAQEFFKLSQAIKDMGLSVYINVSIDGPKLQFSFTDREGKLATVTLYDRNENAAVAATLTRTETLGG